MFAGTGSKVSIAQMATSEAETEAAGAVGKENLKSSCRWFDTAPRHYQAKGLYIVVNL